MEELKAIKEKGRYVQGNKAGQRIGYRNAIDDFVNACEKKFTAMYGQRYVDMRDIEKIAEQLKAGGKKNDL